MLSPAPGQGSPELEGKALVSSPLPEGSQEGVSRRAPAVLTPALLGRMETPAVVSQAEPALFLCVGFQVERLTPRN